MWILGAILVVVVMYLEALLLELEFEVLSHQVLLQLIVDARDLDVCRAECFSFDCICEQSRPISSVL